MAFQRAEGMSIIQALAMTVAEIPVFLYTTFGQSTFSQLRLSPGLRKVLFATALGTVALALAAHQLKRRKHKRKQIADSGGLKPGGVPTAILPLRRTSSVKKGYSRRVQSPSSKSNDTLSGISSLEPSKHSSTHSLASVVAVNASSASIVAVGPWESHNPDEPIDGADSNAENLYFQGMELFEEALHKWQQALHIGQRCGSSTPTAQISEILNDTMSEDLPEDSQNKDLTNRLEVLLQRAYNLQEEFGTCTPHESSMLMDLEGALMFPLSDSRSQLRMDDDYSTTSEDSFFSAAELFDNLNLRDLPLLPSKPAAAYEEALQLVQKGDVLCRTLRTELLACYNDHDFLAKLHCVRQAFQLLLEDERNQLFFSEVGKQMVSGLMVKAEKNPKRFHENYEEMICYTVKEETWPTTQKELEGRGVVCMNFFDIALDFILMDAFEDLENPPTSVIAVLRNRWLSDSFKETALATACWSVLKAKRRLLMVPDGFISHFYSVSEQVSPVLAFGFLGPKEQLTENCNFFKHQFVQYLKDMFDLDKVRYTTVQSLAEDILHLSQRRSEILLAYLGIETVREMNGDVPVENRSLEHQI